MNVAVTCLVSPHFVGRDPAAEFKKIDINGGGFVLFEEFCNWALKHKLDVEEEDERGDGCACIVM